MGADLVAAFPGARAIFAQADDVLGFLLSDLCFNGPAETLNDTLNTQPALFVMGVALVRALSEALGDAFQPACAAGHSLGELTALTAAGAMPFEDGLRLVRERGR
ncbi:MAG: ACP S-malonyltransferase, partial [Anaerolineae bacterium]|nr:ACP S-malonyltransferase [Anaerolineae bacterium]